jgi:uncharacterized protein YjbI with pentapeptide repeats
MSNFHLWHANLSGANLSDSNLSYANLSNADISNANLTHADLSNADISNANLTNVDFSSANLLNTKTRNTLKNGTNAEDNADAFNIEQVFPNLREELKLNPILKQIVYIDELRE